MALELGIIDRKGTAEPMIDVVFGATESDFFTALHAPGINRLFGVHHFKDRELAVESFKDRNIRFRAHPSELNAQEYDK